MRTLIDEVRHFHRVKEERERLAAQVAAFYLACGVDLSAALAAPHDERERVIKKLERLMERERLRGVRRHWAYDLNRHVALKQARDRLVSLRVVPRRPPK